MLVIVKNNDINQALRKLKKKMFNEGIIKELRKREFYEQPSVKRRRERAEAVKRAARKQRDKYIELNLIVAPVKPKKEPYIKRKPV